MAVSTERLRCDIEGNAEHGSIPADTGAGRTVLTGTAANRSAREQFVSRLEAAGLDVRVDSVGNIVGRWCPESADPDVQAVASGSHLDSVPEGGIFDGPLGVYAALEAVRALQESDVSPVRPVEVVCFTEEEGARFSGGLLGSSVAAGKRSVVEALALTDSEGKTLEEALDQIGFRGAGRVDASEWDAWLELHIEQGTRLEDADTPVGVVTDVTGVMQCETELIGEANHAGSTPMGERTDSLAAASEFILNFERAANEVVAAHSETAVGTVGTISAKPGATNVVPGRTTLTLDIRDVEHESMTMLESRARESLRYLERSRGVETSLSRTLDVEPTPLSQRCQAALREGAGDHGFRALDLHSGAGHDTMHIASVTDAGLLFAPSRDGISHNPAEWTDWEDCAAATSVLTAALARLASA